MNKRQTVIFDDFGDPEVILGIDLVAEQIPPFFLYGDKILVFTSDELVKKSLYLRVLEQEFKFLYMLRKIGFFRDYGEVKLVASLIENNSPKR
jgi:hypothetical protein